VLLALRRAEVEVGAVPAAEVAGVLQRLDALEGLLARVLAAGALALRRRDLALSGHEVMEILGSGPGRHVGEALRHLTERVIEDPACNTREGLTALLLARKS
jgi:tRNA nucleotidyltransferase (CCA-adding enzyme)